MKASAIEAADQAQSTTNGEQTGDEALPRMSRVQLWSVWAIAVSLFLFWADPIWRHPWDIDLVNEAIFWSYIPIPVLVAGCLWWSKRLSLRAFFLDALELTFLKYAVTFTIALVLWEAVPAPAAAAHQSPVRTAHEQMDNEPPAAPTPIDPDSTGAVEITVVDTAGRPIRGAMVHVAAGLEGYVFAPPGEPLVLSSPRDAATPPLTVARAGQTIAARSTDGRLHTLVATKDGATFFNVPLLPSGEPNHVGLHEAAGLVTTRCNVHGDGEGQGRLLVLDHPFFGVSDTDGVVELAGVPAGTVRIAAIPPGAERAPLDSQAVDVIARQKSASRIVLK